MIPLELNKHKSLLPIFGVLALMIALFVVLFTGASGITRPNIERRLQQFSEQIGKEAAASGREGKLSYEDISIAGWGYNKQGSVSNVILELSQKSLLDTNKWSLSTTKMLVLPDPHSPERLFFLFGEPINVIENSQLKSIVTFSAPLRYGYFDGTLNQKHIIEHTVNFPNQVTLTSVKAAGESGGEPGRITITYDSNPLFYVAWLPDSHERDVKYEFHNVIVNDSDDGMQVNMASLSSLHHESETADHQLQGQYTLLITDLILRGKDKHSTPYLVKADLNYVSDRSAVDVKLPVFANADITVNQLSLATEEFKISASGKLSMAADDPLPFGNLTVVIENAKQFLASDLLPESGRAAAAKALHAITGQSADTTEPLMLPLKREKNGVLYIGNVTFEALAASIFTDMLKSPQPAKPVLPPGAEPQPVNPQAPVKGSP